MSGLSEQQLDARLAELEATRNNLQTRVELLEKQVTDLKVQSADLSPMGLYKVQDDHLILQFRKPVEVDVALAEDRTLYLARNRDLGIDSFAHSRSELISEVQDLVLFLWREYAQQPDEKLSVDARDLKARLLDAIEEIRID